MEGVRTYLFAVSAVAVLCGLCHRFLGKTGAGAAARLVCAVFLVYTVIQPLDSYSSGFWDRIQFDFSSAADEAIAQGQQNTQKQMAQIIKEKIAAYILEKASHLHADLQVCVQVSDEAIPKPVSVQLKGNISPYNQLQLQSLIAQQLGISKEHQQWTSGK